MHRTVAQLLDLLGPAHPPQDAAVRKPAKTPKSKRHATDPNQEGQAENGGSHRRKRKSTAQDVDGPGHPKPSKRRKKKDREAAEDQIQVQVQPPTQAPEADMLPPEMPGALPVGVPPLRLLYNTQSRSSTQNGAGMDSTSSYPEGLVGVSASPAEPPPLAAVSRPASVPPILALPPAEVERRRDVAVKLLGEHSIDPQTLSEEQFSIFSNQSPELQKESLKMLVKYGAERLRIVHPSKQAPADGGAETAAQGRGSESPAATTTNAALVTEPPSALATTKWPRQKASRRSCESCRNRKIKCARELPSCSQCIASRKFCQYLPAKSRKTKAGQVQEMEEAQEAQEDEPEVPRAPEPQNDTLQPGPISPPMNHQPTYPEPSSRAYQDSSGYNFPQPAASQQAWPASAGAEYKHTHTQEPSTISSIAQEAQGVSAQPYSEESHRVTGPSTSNYPPSEPHASHRAQQPAMNNIATTGVNPNIRSSLQATGSNASPPNEQASLPAQSMPRNPSPLQTFKSRQPHGALQQASELSRVASNRNANLSPPTQITPYTPAAPTSRGASRQGARAQTRTPTQGQSVPRQPPSNSTYSASAGSDSTSTPSYNRYPTQSNNESGQSSSRVPHTKPYGTTPSSAYTNYDGYNARSHNASTTAPSASPVTQETSSSYTATAAPRASQWGTTSTSRTRNSPYDMNPSNPTTSSYSTNAQQSPVAAPFNSSLRPTTQTGSSTVSSYNQQPQGQQSSYVSYPSQQQPSSSSQSSWYGFGSSGTPSSGYGTSARGGGTDGYAGSAASHAGGHYGQQHQSVVQPGHAYGSMNTEDQALYNLLQSNSGT